jgi:hypothetical protein
MTHDVVRGANSLEIPAFARPSPVLQYFKKKIRNKMVKGVQLSSTSSILIRLEIQPGRA